MQTVRAYACALDISPTTVVQRAKCGGGHTWEKWESGAGSPTLRTAEKLLKYIADNPAPDAGAEPMKAAG